MILLTQLLFGLFFVLPPFHSPPLLSSPSLFPQLLTADTHIIRGNESTAFWRLRNNGHSVPHTSLCLSVVTPGLRSLDMVAFSPEEAKSLHDALLTLLNAAGVALGWPATRTSSVWLYSTTVFCSYIYVSCALPPFLSFFLSLSPSLFIFLSCLLCREICVNVAP